MNRTEITELMNIINEIIGEPIGEPIEAPCIQFAIIPPYFKELFIIIGNKIREERTMIPTLKTKYDEFDELYKKWLMETFFDKNNLSTYNTDMSERVQDVDGTVYSRYHREFCNPAKKCDIPEPFKTDITSNTHIVFYYPILENCLHECGTRIRFMNKENQQIELTLPADENVVYCLRDCCFSHISPTAIPIERDKPITRVIVRSYITPNGMSWETSRCPSLVADWGRGGNLYNKKRKVKSYKSKPKNKRKSRIRTKTHKRK